ncbi:E3 ubiquitin-protein ligase CHIP [Galendromus occidentalis]|uniref:E3 ubiquitin-protein ligase CHIP n=1 Tax=Galendromus occidentalis TaxID=34638 RepID=A0AAJ6QUZ7_9ACAR|nr:E3 ubiquitin-protein ligase CHIP [Galendromus occidentalis]
MKGSGGKQQVKMESLTADELRELGNKLFSVRKYDEACQCYSKAIIKNPSVPLYFTNRALTYTKLHQWELAIQDCRRAIDLDATNVKGQFFLGTALLELDSLDEAIVHLQRALDLAKEQKMNYGDDIAVQLRIARKKRWNLQEDKRVQQEIELQGYLNQLIISDFEKKLRDAENNKAPASEVAKIQDKHEGVLSEVNQLFAKVDERRRKREVPDFLCGKISFEIMNEPVITPSGITYDRKDIEEHLQRVGHFDPVTRTPLTQDQLIPNLAMKEVVDTFVGENPWVQDF